jgi:hypothetical protein
MPARLVRSDVLLGPIIVRDGKVIGSWRRTPDGAVTTRLLAKLARAERDALDAALEAAIARFGRFIEPPRAKTAR